MKALVSHLSCRNLSGECVAIRNYCLLRISLVPSLVIVVTGIIGIPSIIGSPWSWSARSCRYRLAVSVKCRLTVSVVFRATIPRRWSSVNRPGYHCWFARFVWNLSPILCKRTVFCLNHRINWSSGLATKDMWDICAFISHQSVVMRSKIMAQRDGKPNLTLYSMAEGECIMYRKIRPTMWFNGSHLVFYLSFQREDAQAGDDMPTNDTSHSQWLSCFLIEELHEDAFIETHV